MSFFTPPPRASGPKRTLSQELRPPPSDSSAPHSSRLPLPVPTRSYPSGPNGTDSTAPAQDGVAFGSGLAMGALSPLPHPPTSLQRRPYYPSHHYVLPRLPQSLLADGFGTTPHELNHSFSTAHASARAQEVAAAAAGSASSSAIASPRGLPAASQPPATASVQLPIEPIVTRHMYLLKALESVEPAAAPSKFVSDEWAMRNRYQNIIPNDEFRVKLGAAPPGLGPAPMPLSMTRLPLSASSGGSSTATAAGAGPSFSTGAAAAATAAAPTAAAHPRAGEAALSGPVSSDGYAGSGGLVLSGLNTVAPPGLRRSVSLTGGAAAAAAAAAAANASGPMGGASATTGANNGGFVTIDENATIAESIAAAAAAAAANADAGASGEGESDTPVIRRTILLTTPAPPTPTTSSSSAPGGTTATAVPSLTAPAPAAAERTRPGSLNTGAAAAGSGVVSRAPHSARGAGLRVSVPAAPSAGVGVSAALPLPLPLPLPVPVQLSSSAQGKAGAAGAHDNGGGVGMGVTSPLPLPRRPASVTGARPSPLTTTGDGSGVPGSLGDDDGVGDGEGGAGVSRVYPFPDPSPTASAGDAAPGFAGAAGSVGSGGSGGRVMTDVPTPGPGSSGDSAASATSSSAAATAAVDGGRVGQAMESRCGNCGGSSCPGCSPDNPHGSTICDDIYDDDDASACDYINASHVPPLLPRAPQRGIAAQAPPRHCVPDYWRMVYEQRCPLLVMLTQLWAPGRPGSRQQRAPKADRYWPLSFAEIASRAAEEARATSAEAAYAVGRERSELVAAAAGATKRATAAAAAAAADAEYCASVAAAVRLPFTRDAAAPLDAGGVDDNSAGVGMDDNDHCHFMTPPRSSAAPARPAHAHGAGQATATGAGAAAGGVPGIVPTDAESAAAAGPPPMPTLAWLRTRPLMRLDDPSCATLTGAGAKARARAGAGAESSGAAGTVGLTVAAGAVINCKDTIIRELFVVPTATLFPPTSAPSAANNAMGDRESSSPTSSACLSNGVDAGVRRVWLLHYLGWPDFGVPSKLDALFVLFARYRHLRAVAAAEEAASEGALGWGIDVGAGGLAEVTRRHTKGPVVVHCSAGVGRTGCFMAIDAVLSYAGATIAAVDSGAVARKPLTATASGSSTGGSLSGSGRDSLSGSGAFSSCSPVAAERGSEKWVHAAHGVDLTTVFQAALGLRRCRPAMIQTPAQYSLVYSFVEYCASHPRRNLVGLP